MKYFSDLIKDFLVIPLAYFNGLKAQKDAQRIEDLEFDLETAKRVEDVAISLDRDAALERLHKNNRVRD